MYPGGLPTADGIISLTITGLKLYRGARQAVEKFEAAKQLLDSLDLSLRLLEESVQDTLGKDDLRNQVEVARKAWEVLHGYLDDFKERLGKENAKKCTSIPKKLQWAFDELDGKLNSLCARVQFCLSAVIPALHLNTDHKIGTISTELSELKKMLTPLVLESVSQAPSEDADQNKNEISQHTQSTECAIIPCWQRKQGCFCRCHARSRVTAEHNRHLFIDLAGWSSLFLNCDVGSCNSRRYTMQLRFAPSQYGVPFAFMAAFELSTSWIPRISLSLPVVRRYTSPGFSLLWELERSCYDRSKRCQKLAEIQRLLISGEATYRDVDPSGEGWLEKLLLYPWSLGFRNDQWDLVEFFITRSPKEVLDNPRLLHACARWIGEGPHMAMLDTLLGAGLDPGSTDAACFQEWPSFSSPGWICETITPDPFFVEWIQISLRREPGYAGCDALSETILTGSMSEFEQALGKSKDARDLPRLSPNAFGQTAVHLAVLIPARLKRLLEDGANPDPVDKGGSTPLMYAAAYGYPESVRHLMEYTERPMLVDKRNRRVFVDYAIRRGHIEIIEMVVQKLRAQGSNEGAMNVLDRCLRYYIVSGDQADDLDFSLLNRLFLLKADPNVHNGKSTLLHLACSEKQVQRVLDAGFTAVNSRDKEGLTPLMKVVHRCHLPVIKRLIRPEADINCQDDTGWTALHHLIQSFINRFASKRGNLDDRHFDQWVNFVSSFHFLIKSGADCFCRDRCKCACSSRGCSAITVALHRTMKQMKGGFGDRISLVLMDLLCIVENRAEANLEEYLQDVERYRKFVESDLEHTCCYWRDDYYAGSREVDGDTTLAKHAQFNAAFEHPSPSSTLIRNSIVEELARFFKHLETRAYQTYKDELSRHIPEEPGTTYEIDEKNDEFVETIHCSMEPQLFAVDTESSRDCLDRARGSLQSVGFHQRGTLDAYISNSLEILTEIETAMQNLE